MVDTNIPSELTRDTPDVRVATFLENAGRERVYLSLITLGEICKGIDVLPLSRKRTGLQEWLDRDVRVRFAGRILPVTEYVAERWRHLAAAAKRRGVTVTVVDGILAATALEHDLTLATRNIRDFADLGVALLNPWDEV